MLLKDKVIILTGASSGIGKAGALALAEEGAKVYIVARREEKLAEIADEAKDLEGELIPAAADVTDDERRKEIVQKVLDENGRIDVLINNAGVLDNYESPEHVKDETWEKVMDINVTAVMKWVREVLPGMRENKSGVILNTASVGGLNGVRGGLPYVASKHAVVGLTKNVGYMYAEEGIRCVAIAPGSIETDIGKKVSGADEETLEKMMPAVKIFPHLGQPEDIANTMVFLASDKAKFVNGTVVVVDGGWTAV